jgi:hypothetical protein
MAGIPDDKLKLGRALLAGGPVTVEMLQRELDSSGKSASVLGKALLQAGFPREEELIYAILSKLRVPRINAKNTKIPLETVRLLPEGLAKKHRMLALDQMGSILVIVTPNAGNDAAMSEVRKATGYAIFPIQSDVKSCTQAEFDGIVKDYYGRLPAAGLKAAQPLSDQPIVIHQVAPVGTVNGVVQAIPQGTSSEDFFWRTYQSASVPAVARD